MRGEGIQADIRYILRILMRALREARKGNRNSLIDKLTAMNIYLQLMIRRLACQQLPGRKPRAKRKPPVKR